MTPALGDPLGREWIVVNSQGMESWLRQQATERLGITANMKMPFLQAFVDELVGRHAELGAHREKGSPGAFARTTLHLRILDALGRLEFEDAELRSYLSAESHGLLRRYQLAGRLAQLFDRYQIHRPDLLDLWEGDDVVLDWQARLWNALREESEEPSLTETLRRLAREMDRVELGAVGGRPAIERLALFNLTTLPPIYLDVFTALAERIPVRLFTMEVSRRPLDLGETGTEPPDAPPSLPPALEPLRVWATQGREFVDLLAAGRRCTWDRRFVDPLVEADEAPSMLARLQGLILDLERTRPEEKLPVDPADRSIVFHSCHGPQREIEVLHDRLLALFEADPGLTPRDVIVMAPDISVYLPHIEASFSRPPHVASRAVDGGGREEGKREEAKAKGDESRPLPSLPYSVADRLDLAQSPVYQAFTAILATATSRFKVNEILDLFALPLVQAHLELGEGDAELVARWAKDTAIRWGWNEAHRAELDLPAYRDGSWEAGLDRLLAGYAIGPEPERPDGNLYDGIAPFADLEGERAVLLGRVAEFLAGLRALAEGLGKDRPLPEWRDWISREILDVFFARVREEHFLEIERIRRSLDELAGLAETVGFVEAVPSSLVVDHLQQSVGASVSGVGFFRGKITFCSLMPMRSVPARVICLLGMNDGEFPRQDRALGFDRSAGDHRPGDRSRRLEDRTLFLEALLAARDQLYVSYRGRTRADNTSTLPSTLVTELREIMGELFSFGEPQKSRFDAKPLGPNEVEHHLQAFAPAYFDGSDPELFSYSRNDGLGARAALAPAPPRPLFDGPEAPPVLPPVDPADESLTRLSPAVLARFLAAPCAFLLRRRLGVDLATGARVELSDDEFERDHLHEFRRRQFVLEALLRGDDPMRCQAALMGMGWLADRPADRNAFENEWHRVETFARTPCVPLDDGLSPLEDALSREQGRREILVRRPGSPEGDGPLPLEIHGVVEPVVDRTRLVHGLARMKLCTRFTCLVEHLCACAGGAGLSTALVGAEEHQERNKAGLPLALVYAPVETARAAAIVERFLDLYETGLRRPLAFDLDAFGHVLAAAAKEGRESIEARREAKTVETVYDEGSAVAACLGPDGPWPHDEFHELCLFFFDLFAEHEREVGA